MKAFFLPPWPFGPKRCQYYFCQCPKCGFQQMYEVGSAEAHHIGDPEEGSAMQTVEKLPSTCPKCGAKLKKSEMRSPIKY